MTDPRTTLETYAAQPVAIREGLCRWEYAPEAIAAARAVLDVADQWQGGPCLVGYKVTNDDDDDSECLHCASEAIRRAITTALGGQP